MSSERAAVVGYWTKWRKMRAKENKNKIKKEKRNCTAEVIRIRTARTHLGKRGGGKWASLHFFCSEREYSAFVHFNKNGQLCHLIRCSFHDLQTWATLRMHSVFWARGCPIHIWQKRGPLFVVCFVVNFARSWPGSQNGHHINEVWTVSNNHIINEISLFPDHWGFYSRTYLWIVYLTVKEIKFFFWKFKTIRLHFRYVCVFSVFLKIDDVLVLTYMYIYI